MALLEMFQYFNELTASRRANPTEDLASAIANARIDGEPLVRHRNGVVLRDHRDGRPRHDQSDDRRRAAGADREPRPAARLRATRPDTAGHRGDDPLGHSGEGVHAHRAEDNELRGVPIAAGESVLLSYLSANRDEDVFADPFRFDVGREPNKHVAFGYGVHFCLGARWPAWR